MRKRSWYIFFFLLIAALGAALAQSSDAKAKPKKEPSVKAYLLVGDVYYSSGEYDAALIAFRRALEKEPNNAYALYGLGRTQLRLLQFSSAIENIKRAIALDSNYAPAYVSLAQAYTNRYTYAEDKDAAKSYLQQALLILDDAKRVDANYYPIYNQRGLVYQYLGDLKKAEQAFKQALKLGSKDSVVRYNLAQVYLSQGRLDEALAMLQEGVKIDPSSAQLQLLLGKVLAVKGKLPEAETALSKASALEPLNAGSWLYLGQVYFLEEKYKDAEKALQKSIELDPLSFPESYYYLGRVHLAEGKSDAAASDFSKAVKLSERNADYHYWLGKSLLAQNKREEAKAEFEKTLKLAPNFEAAKKELSSFK